MRALARVLGICLAAAAPLVLTSSLGTDARARFQEIFAFPGGAAGWYPLGPLFVDRSGNLYGTTNAGGNTGCLGYGCGTAFKLTPRTDSYTLTTIHVFGAGQDGSNPSGGLTADATGALYGTAQFALGSNGPTGMVFKLTPSPSGYQESVINRFQGKTSGTYPIDGVIADADGVLYGTTVYGGAPSCKCGTVYKLLPTGAGYTQKVIYGFTGSFDGGSRPQSPVIEDARGNLYGTTSLGGNGGCGPAWGCGAVFKLTPTGSNYVFTSLHVFVGGSDGGYPTGALTIDASGALYGATVWGGTTGGRCQHIGCGVVFKLTPTHSGYAEQILYAFKGATKGPPDGISPNGNLLLDASGAIYGTTAYDGASECLQHGVSCGTVFKLTPKAGSGYVESILHRFSGTERGNAPISGLVRGARGAVYGVTSAGGALNCGGPLPGCGTVYRLTL